MKVAALYDIHGNLPALKAVLHEVNESGADEIVVGGDVVPGPMSRECLETLMSIHIPVHFIRGNGETSVLDHLANNQTGGLPENALEAIRVLGGTVASGAS